MSETSTFLSHLTERPPIWPGTTRRSGYPWSGSSGSPFIAHASIIPLPLSSHQRKSWLVPYLPSGRSSAPSKMTWAARRPIQPSGPQLPSLRGLARARMSERYTPVKRAVERPAAPQEKPSDLRTMFCSLRRLPAHTSVMGSVTTSNCDCRSARDSSSSCSTKLLGLGSAFSRTPPRVSVRTRRR